MKYLVLVAGLLMAPALAYAGPCHSLRPKCTPNQVNSGSVFAECQTAAAYEAAKLKFAECLADAARSGP